MSVTVKLLAASRLGLASTMNAGIVVPPTLTVEPPGICSITGTISFSASAPSELTSYFFEINAIVTTVGWSGSETRRVGCTVVGRSCAAPCSASSVFAMSSVVVDWSEKVAAIETEPLSIVVRMFTKYGWPAR
jgi:hypothetical protein